MSGDVHYQTHERDPLFCGSTMTVLCSTWTPPGRSMGVYWTDTPLQRALGKGHNTPEIMALTPAGLETPTHWDLN